MCCACDPLPFPSPCLAIACLASPCLPVPCTCHPIATDCCPCLQACCLLGLPSCTCRPLPYLCGHCLMIVLADLICLPALCAVPFGVPAPCLTVIVGLLCCAVSGLPQCALTPQCLAAFMYTLAPHTHHPTFIDCMASPWDLPFLPLPCLPLPPVACVTMRIYISDIFPDPIVPYAVSILLIQVLNLCLTIPYDLILFPFVVYCPCPLWCVFVSTYSSCVLVYLACIPPSWTCPPWFGPSVRFLALPLWLLFPFR